jgi:glycosyltransferase involved in cell wall biosynthesis
VSTKELDAGTVVNWIEDSFVLCASSMIEKIALFMPSFAGGGTERVFLSLARGFSDRGKKVDLIVADSTGELKTQMDERVRVFDLQSKRVSLCLPRLVNYLQKEKPSILLSGLTYANIIAILAKQLSHSATSIVISEHNFLSPKIRQEIGFKEKVVLFLARFYYRHPNGIVAVSAGVKNDLSSYLRVPLSRIQTISNPLDLEKVETRSGDLIQHSWLDQKKAPVILSAGRLVWQKDFTTLLSAFEIILAKMDARLIIIGEGSDRQALEKQIAAANLSAKVSLAGFQQNPYAFMRHSDVFVLSSIYEGFAMVLVEAMACEVPVISTNIPGGPTEILQFGKFGRLVPPRNPEAMAQAIIDILKNPPDTTPAKIRAQDYSLGRVVDQYLGFFAEVQEHSQKYTR